MCNSCGLVDVRKSGFLLLSLVSSFLNYFAKPTPESMDNAILHYVFACLQTSAVRPPVVHAIMQLVDNLLNNGNNQLS